MARNKYPQETIDAILDASLRLFVEKGYDNTSIQDIVGQLGGLTKGAIYHHFKSKEEIFQAVCNRIGQQSMVHATAIRDNKEMNGLEKLRTFCSPYANPNCKAIWSLSMPVLQDPRFFQESIRSIFELTAPVYIQPVIEEGMGDGSIVTDSPKELAQVITLLFNIWVNPVIDWVTPRDLEHKVRFLDRLLRGIGLEILDEEMIDQFVALAHLVNL